MTTYKILVIDDAFFIRNLIKKAVMRKPIKNDVHFEIIGEAQDGATGLEMCKELQPDIITVDFNIPELNGLDFAKYLKEMNPKIPILMISSNTDPTFPQQVDEIGCHFLQKPFQEAHLWMRLDTLVNEIENFDENQVQETKVSEETLSVLEEITMEVEAELEEEQIELEEISLPKVNQPKQTNEPTKKKKKKKKKNNSGDLFGLQIDDSIVIKPKSEITTKVDTKIEPIKEKPVQNVIPVPTIQIEKLIEPINEPKKNDNIEINKPSMNIPKIDLNLGKSLEENIIIEDDSTNIPKIDLNLGKPLEEDIIIEDDEDILVDEPLTAIVDDEEIIIDDEDVPLIIDDEDDTLIIIDDEEEIIIEDEEEEDDDIIIDDGDDEFEIIGDDDIFIGDNITQNNEDNISNTSGIKIGLNIKKAPVEEKEDLSLLSEKELTIHNLIENVSYSYQTEMSYVLHVMEKIKRPEAYVVEDNPINEEPKKQNKLGIEQPVEIIKDLTKEDEEAEFDKLFAEFNPNLDLNTPSSPKQTKEIKKEIDLKNSPAISNTIVIEPPKSQKVQALYGGKKEENIEFVLPIEDKPKKVSIFTKIFNFFNKKK